MIKCSSSESKEIKFEVMCCVFCVLAESLSARFDLNGGQDPSDSRTQKNASTTIKT